MAKDEISFEDFLQNVGHEILVFVNETHEFMLQNGCTFKIEAAKSGHVVSYILMKTKKVIANYVFRKNGLIIRIYGDNISQYAEILDVLPDGMTAAIEKAPACKRLIDPSKCNSRCGMGYVFELKGSPIQRCRYGSFMFDVKGENCAAIRAFLEREIKERIA